MHGPNAFIGGDAQPLAPTGIGTIQAVLDQPRVDPVLPRTPLPLTSPDDLVQPTNPTPWVSVVNVLVIAALGLLALAVLRRSRARPHDSGQPASSGSRGSSAVDSE